MTIWKTRWRSIWVGLLLFTVLAVTLGTLGARWVLRGDHDRPAHLQWVEICTETGTRWVLMDLGIRP